MCKSLQRLEVLCSRACRCIFRTLYEGLVDLGDEEGGGCGNVIRACRFQWAAGGKDTYSAGILSLMRCPPSGAGPIRLENLASARRIEALLSLATD